MKRIKRHFTGRLSYVYLHLDDIERIVDILKTDLPNITFKDEESEYESLDEMKELLGVKAKQITIEATKNERPYGGVTLTINDRRIWLHADGEYEPLRHQITAFITGRVRWYSRIFAPWFWGWILSLFAIMYLSFIEKQAKFSAPPSWFIVSAITVAFLFLISIWHITVYTGVVLERRHAIKGFFSRNLDRILMLIIGGMLTLLGKVLYESIFR